MSESTTKIRLVDVRLASVFVMFSGNAFAGGNTVALVLGVKDSPFYEALACGAKDKAAALGPSLSVAAIDHFAADEQVPVVQAVAAKKPEIAVIVPTDHQSLNRADEEAGSAGRKSGPTGGQEMNALLGGKGSVRVITRPPGSAAQDERTAV